MRRGRRALPIVAGGAIGALVLVLAIGVGNYLAVRRDGSGVGASPAPSVTTSESPAPSSPAASPSASQAAVTSDPSVGTYLRPLVQAWRPTTTTVILSERKQSGNAPLGFTVVAVPADGTGPTPLARIEGAGAAVLRPDGGALAATIEVGPSTTRLASWDLRTGALRWLTREEEGVSVPNPVWSPDGARIYFGKFHRTRGDLGLFYLAASGGAETQVQPSVQELTRNQAPGISVPLLVTTDGLLVWGRGYEGASVEVLELATGRRASYGGIGTVVWRPQQPRFAVQQGGGIGPGRGVELWNDVSGERRAVIGDDISVHGLDFSLDATQLAVSLQAPQRFAYGVSLIPVGPGGGQPAGPVGPEGVRPLWLRAGIAYLYAPLREGGIPGNATELRIADPAQAQPPRTLYRAGAGNILFQHGFVSP